MRGSALIIVLGVFESLGFNSISNNLYLVSHFFPGSDYGDDLNSF